MPKPQPFSKWPDNLPPLETVETLRAQRDELLAALEDEHGPVSLSRTTYHNRAVCPTCALIASIKGGG